MLMVIPSLQIDGKGDVGDDEADGETPWWNIGEGIFDDACKQNGTLHRPYVILVVDWQNELMLFAST